MEIKMIDPHEFHGKTILITGGSKGIGSAIVKRFAALSCNVVFTYGSDDLASKNLIGELKSINTNIFGFKADVRSRNEFSEVISFIKDKFGSIDILVNNAGINKPTDFDQITDEDWDDVLSVNLKGPFLCSQESLPLMKNNGGSIINIGSVSGQYGGPRTAHYAASKAGLISLSQVIARFGAKFNIRSNTIAAGIIESEMAASALDDPAVKKACENIIMNRFGSYEEVAETVLFLASKNSSYITAQTINLNGGLYF